MLKNDVFILFFSAKVRGENISCKLQFYHTVLKLHDAVLKLHDKTAIFKIGDYTPPLWKRTKKMADLTTAQKKDYAKGLFLYENLTQAEIADRTGVSRKTVIRWIEAERWKDIKVSVTITKEEQIKNLYNQLKAINDVISARTEQRYASAAEADTITKLAGAIQKMEGDVGISDIISVGKKFVTWTRKISLDKAKEICSLFDLFIKDNLR
jgi:transcriptional regulator with XRE-family HTH domain